MTTALFTVEVEGDALRDAPLWNALNMHFKTPPSLAISEGRVTIRFRTKEAAAQAQAEAPHTVTVASSTVTLNVAPQKQKSKQKSKQGGTQDATAAASVASTPVRGTPSKGGKKKQGTAQGVQSQNGGDVASPAQKPPGKTRLGGAAPAQQESQPKLQQQATKSNGTVAKSPGARRRQDKQALQRTMPKKQAPKQQQQPKQEQQQPTQADEVLPTMASLALTTGGRGGRGGARRGRGSGRGGARGGRVAVRPPPTPQSELISAESIRKAEVEGYYDGMCPAAEMSARTARGIRNAPGYVWEFEAIGGDAAPSMMLKESTRSAAGKVVDNSSIRSVAAIFQSFAYLTKLVDQTWPKLSQADDTLPFLDWFHFVEDRFNALRADVWHHIQSETPPPETFRLVEKLCDAMNLLASHSVYFLPNIEFNVNLNTASIEKMFHVVASALPVVEKHFENDLPDMYTVLDYAAALYTLCRLSSTLPESLFALLAVLHEKLGDTAVCHQAITLHASAGLSPNAQYMLFVEFFKQLKDYAVHGVVARHLLAMRMKYLQLIVQTYRNPKANVVLSSSFLEHCLGCDITDPDQAMTLTTEQCMTEHKLRVEKPKSKPIGAELRETLLLYGFQDSDCTDSVVITPTTPQYPECDPTGSTLRHYPKWIFDL
eukprot:m.43929 g.43929  ORF g.43929 m.43929 type:complete len:657 (+) comp10807_c0_seq1:296-2266(+)